MPAAKHFPIDLVRRQFPALDAEGEGKRPIYLDNPAGTQVPKCVVDSVADALVEASSNLGGFFPNSRAATDIWSDAHTAMADFLGAGSAREVIIGPNMTSLTYQMSRTIGRRFKPGDELIVTRMDHEGNVSPWLQLAAERDLKIRWLPFNRDTWRIEPEDLLALLNERTALLAVNYASNLTGSINDIRTIAAMAREAGALVYVDAVQYAPHGLIDAAALGADFLVCSSYKFFGPHLGILWGREEHLEGLEAYALRCGPKSLPGRLETGTPQTELLAGLSATVGYFMWLGEQAGGNGEPRVAIAAAYAAFGDHERSLTLRLIDGLSDIRGVTVHGITNPNRIGERVPTVSITHSSRRPRELAERLAKGGIYLWSGHNYAYEVVRHLGLDETEGVLRIGLAHYNTEGEVDELLVALRSLLG